MHPLTQFRRNVEGRGHADLRSLSMSGFMTWCTHNDLLAQSTAETLADLYEKEHYQGQPVSLSDYEKFSPELLAAVEQSGELVVRAATPEESESPPAVSGSRKQTRLVVLLALLLASVLVCLDYLGVDLRQLPEMLVNKPVTRQVASDEPRDVRPVVTNKKFHTSINLDHGGHEGRGVAFVDFDGDGDLDLFMATAVGPRLFENNNAAFDKELASGFGMQGRARTGQWADYDGDAKLDLLITGGQEAPQFWRNDGGQLRPAHDLLPVGPPFNLEGAGWLDHNLDGRPDLLVTNGQHGVFLIEQSAQGFVDKSTSLGFGPAGIGNINGDFVLLTDLDGDGYPDLVYNAGSGVSAVNRAGKGFQLAGWGIQFQTLGGGSKLGLSAVDFDNDGDLDIFVPQPETSLLYRNAGAEGFQLVSDVETGDAAFPAKSSTWEDLDDDGDLDLVVATERGSLEAYRNTGTSFEIASFDWGIAEFPEGQSGRGLMFGDIDQDGDGDLAVAGDQGRGGILVNVTEIPDGRGRLTVRFATPPAPGTKVQIHSPDAIQTRVLGIPENIGSQTPFEARFSVEGDRGVEVRFTKPGASPACFTVSVASKTARMVYAGELEQENEC